MIRLFMTHEVKPEDVEALNKRLDALGLDHRPVLEEEVRVIVYSEIWMGEGLHSPELEALQKEWAGRFAELDVLFLTVHWFPSELRREVSLN